MATRGVTPAQMERSGVNGRHVAGSHSVDRLDHISFKQVVVSKKSFSPHHVNDVNNLILCAIENPNWWNDKLAILSAFELSKL